MGKLTASDKCWFARNQPTEREGERDMKRWRVRDTKRWRVRERERERERESE